jgi:hypothetical protein
MALLVFGQPAPSRVGDSDLDKRARLRGVDGSRYALNVDLDKRPSRLSYDHDRKLSRGEILLVRNVLVGCDQQLKARGFCRRQQLAVLKRRPTLFCRCPNRMAE